MVTVHFTVTSASDAPASGVLIGITHDLPKLKDSGNVLFPHPVQGVATYSYTLHTHLNEIVPLYYAIAFTPFNSLGIGDTVHTTVFIPGEGVANDLKCALHTYM